MPAGPPKFSDTHSCVSEANTREVAFTPSASTSVMVAGMTVDAVGTGAEAMRYTPADAGALRSALTPYSAPPGDSCTSCQLNAMPPVPPVATMSGGVVTDVPYVMYRISDAGTVVLAGVTLPPTYQNPPPVSDGAAMAGWLLKQVVHLVVRSYAAEGRKRATMRGLLMPAVLDRVLRDDTDMHASATDAPSAATASRPFGEFCVTVHAVRPPLVLLGSVIVCTAFPVDPSISSMYTAVAVVAGLDRVRVRCTSTDVVLNAAPSAPTQHTAPTTTASINLATATAMAGLTVACRLLRVIAEGPPPPPSAAAAAAVVASDRYPSLIRVGGTNTVRFRVSVCVYRLPRWRRPAGSGRSTTATPTRRPRASTAHHRGAPLDHPVLHRVHREVRWWWLAVVAAVDTGVAAALHLSQQQQQQQQQRERKGKRGWNGCWKQKISRGGGAGNDGAVGAATHNKMADGPRVRESWRRWQAVAGAPARVGQCATDADFTQAVLHNSCLALSTSFAWQLAATSGCWFKIQHRSNGTAEGRWVTKWNSVGAATVPWGRGSNFNKLASEWGANATR